MRCFGLFAFLVSPLFLSSAAWAQPGSPGGNTPPPIQNCGETLIGNSNGVYFYDSVTYYPPVFGAGGRCGSPYGFGQTSELCSNPYCDPATGCSCVLQELRTGTTPDGELIEYVVCVNSPFHDPYAWYVKDAAGVVTNSRPTDFDEALKFLQSLDGQFKKGTWDDLPAGPAFGWKFSRKEQTQFLAAWVERWRVYMESEQGNDAAKNEAFNRFNGTRQAHGFAVIWPMRFDELRFVGRSLTSGSGAVYHSCLLYTSPSPRDRQKSRMPSSA